MKFPQTCEALMLVKRDGRIEGATPLASRWLREHFGLKPRADVLPPNLRRWLSVPQGKRGQCRPFTVENDYARLVITLLHPEADKCFPLLIEKRPLGAPRTRLRRLGLTVREAEVFSFMRDGETNGHIAKVLGVAESTVKRHVEHILEKFGVDNRTAAVARAADLG